MIYMFLSNNPSSGDINSSNLPCKYRNLGMNRVGLAPGFGVIKLFCAQIN